MISSLRSTLATATTVACLLPAHFAEARDYSQTPTAELHEELDKRPMAAPIATTIVGGISLVAGGYLALYGLSLQTACQFVAQPCDGGNQVVIGGIMAGAGAVVTTAGTIWLISWDQTRRDISNELGRRQVSANLRVAPWFGATHAGLHLTATF